MLIIEDDPYYFLQFEKVQRQEIFSLNDKRQPVNLTFINNEQRSQLVHVMFTCVAAVGSHVSLHGC